MTPVADAARLVATPGSQHRLEGLVARRVAARPGACAVQEHDGRVITYGQLWDQSGELAQVLAGMGVGRGSVAAIALDRSADMVVAVLGVARTGGAYVLLDPYSPPARNALIVSEAAARVIVEGPVPAPWSPPGSTARVALPLPGRDAVLRQAGVPPARREPGGDLHTGSKWQPAGTSGGNPEDPLYIAYTSGSTGRPKGVIASHRAVAHFSTESNLCTLSAFDRVSSLSNPASDATTLEIWKPLVAGAAIVVLPAVAELDIQDWRPMLRESKVTVMFMMAGLVDLISRADPAAFASVDTLIFGGEALHPGALLRICQAAPPRRLVLGYGPTETTVFATSYDCTAERVAGRDRIPLGFPLEGYRLALLGEDGQPVTGGEVGELYIGGPGVASGYLARPGLTAQRFVRLPGDPAQRVVYRSGDLVRRLPDGALEFVGRTDRQVKVRGYRIELEEVEHGVLATGLVDAAIVERVEGELNAHLVCFYTPREAGTTLDGETDLRIRLAAATAAKLPGYMVPARWVAVDELPRTSIGKVDRGHLLSSLARSDGRRLRPGHAR
jgi:amino acid adenylation domain-containing protein